MNALSVGLVAGAALNVNHVLLAVYLDDLALLLLELATGDNDLIVLDNGQRADLNGNYYKTEKEVKQQPCISGTNP